MNVLTECNGLFGVEGLYDPEFPSRECAQAVVDMENGENPPRDWIETRRRLALAGYTEKDWQ